MKECSVEGPEEKGHFKGGCTAHCRRCKIEEDVEKAAQMDLLGATAIEDKLQDFVPLAVKSLLQGGMCVLLLLLFVSLLKKSY